MTDATNHQTIPDDAQGPMTPRQRMSALWRLAWPTVLARAGILIMALVDVVMVGHYSTLELAYASLGMSIFVPALVTGIGLLIGVMVLCSHAMGREDKRECGAVFLRGLPWAALLGAIGALLCAFGEFWLTLFGHEPHLAAGGGGVALVVAIGIPAQLLYVACSFFLESTGRSRPGMVAMILANLVNIALNWVFIYGNLGAPELGAVGSAMTTAAVRVFLLAALLGYIYTRSDIADYGLTLRFRLNWGPGGWPAGAAMRGIGYAAGASVFFETSAFAMVMQFAGWMGAGVLAAYAIAHNLEALLFMIALGLSSATAVRVGRAFGAAPQGGGADEAALEAWTGLGVVLAAMLAAALIVWSAPGALAALYSSDPEAIALATVFLPWIGVVILADGAQLLMGQAVRALGDAWGATRLYFIAYWLAFAPSAYLLGVHFGYGAPGLFMGGVIGGVVSLTLQFRRFRQLIRKARA